MSPVGSTKELVLCALYLVLCFARLELNHTTSSSLNFKAQSTNIILRGGVTGNTSGFEPEDEGSIPSPAANLLRLNAKKVTSIVIRGYVYCEDEAQIFAEPFDDVRLMCRR